ncbi:MAG TPA: amino acid adenylation domain-containing protein, partial [Bryobacteraceae bacterium]
MRPGLARRIRDAARRLGVSTASVFHVAWAQVLARASGREDVVFGTVLFGRMRVAGDAQQAMGLFINTLPVRILLDRQSVEDCVRNAHLQLADLMRHEHASLVLAQSCSPIAAPTPLLTAILNYRHRQDVPTEAVREVWNGIEVLRAEERTNYPVSLSVDDLGEEFRLTAQVQMPVAPTRVCDYMAVSLQSLSDALESDPGRAVGSANVLPPSELEQIAAWNRTQDDCPSNVCVHELFEARAKTMPDAPAVTFGGAELSYSELNRRANQLARYLQTMGVKPDSRVALCLMRSFEMVVALLAVLKAGGAYVPLDPEYPEDRLKYMAEDCGAVVLLTQRSYQDSFAGQSVSALDITQACLACGHFSDSDLDRAEAPVAPENAAYVIYTSGSSGLPKGVINEHRAVVNRLLWMQRAYGLNATDVVLQKTPFSFDVSVWEFFWPLLAGARLAVAQPGGHRDPGYLLETIRTEHVTTVHFVPSMLQQFVSHSDRLDCPALRRVICSGESLPAPLVRQFHDKMPLIALYNLYGPTEAAIDVTAWTCPPDPDPVCVPIGRPISNIQIRILDAQMGFAPVGVAGELYIGGAGVARGYVDKPAMTAERFVPDPFAADAGARMYRTGDLARWLEDGNIEYLGRNDLQTKIRGIRIELAEIEARLTQHAAIREAVVAAWDDGPGDKQLVAYYTTAVVEPPDAQSLRDFLSKQLPEYMIPAAFVRMETLPLTSNGKLDRKSLPKPGDSAYARTQFAWPRGELQTVLAHAYADLLRVDRVGRHDNFFALGGHSLQVLRLVKVLKRVGIEILLTDVFEHPTIESLAAHLSTRGDTQIHDRAIPLRSSGRQRPMFMPYEGTGEVLYASVLAPHIAAGIPVYALPYVEPERAQLRTVEAMAARMVRMIREVQPEGPYRIAGWCVAGIFAYEIAAQLMGQDQTVEVLALLDVDPPNVPELTPEDATQQLMQLFELTIGRVKRDHPVLLDLRSVSASADFDSLLQRSRELSALPAFLADLSTGEVQSYLHRLYTIRRAKLQYVPQPLPIPIQFFQAEDDLRERGDLLEGWKSLVPENDFQVISIKGRHHSMLRGANVEA